MSKSCFFNINAFLLFSSYPVIGTLVWNEKHGAYELEGGEKDSFTKPGK